MGAKYSYGVWEQFADQASIIMGRKTKVFRVSTLWQDICHFLILQLHTSNAAQLGWFVLHDLQQVGYMYAIYRELAASREVLSNNLLQC